MGPQTSVGMIRLMLCTLRMLMTVPAVWSPDDITTNE